MILVDHAKGSIELLPLIQRYGVPAEKANLPYADFSFEGIGPTGNPCYVGIERKTLHDMLHCIDDSRYTGFQKVGMGQLYNVSVLLLEGNWKPHDQTLDLMEGFRDGTSWGPCKYRSRTNPYSKLYRYLISVARSGVIITYSRNMVHSAINICEWYHYWQKKQHTSLLEVQQLNIPDMRHHPSLTRMWASDLDGVGVQKSMEAEELFKRPIVLANASEVDWMKIEGVGVSTAQKIVRQIYGR